MIFNFLREADTFIQHFLRQIAICRAVSQGGGGDAACSPLCSLPREGDREQMDSYEIYFS